MGGWPNGLGPLCLLPLGHCSMCSHCTAMSAQTFGSYTVDCWLCTAVSCPALMTLQPCPAWEPLFGPSVIDQVLLVVHWLASAASAVCATFCPRQTSPLGAVCVSLWGCQGRSAVYAAGAQAPGVVGGVQKHIRDQLMVETLFQPFFAHQCITKQQFR